MKDLNTYKGVVVPMISPVKADLSIDRDSVASIMKTFTYSEVSVFLLGTTGESTSLSEIQKSDLVQIALEHRETKSNMKVYAGVSSNCLQESIDLAKKFTKFGVDAVVAHLPWYYPMSHENMITYFTNLADNIDCPLLLYNNPITVKQSIPLEVVEELSYHKNIIGFKDSERGKDRLDQAINLWKNRPDFVFLLGWAAMSAYGILHGCHGIVPSTGNLVPELYRRLYDAAAKGEEDESMKYQIITDRISAIYQQDKNISQSIPALKILMSAINLSEPYSLPPLYMPGDNEKEYLIQQLINELKTVDI